MQHNTIYIYYNRQLAHSIDRNLQYDLHLIVLVIQVDSANSIFTLQSHAQTGLEYIGRHNQ